MPRRESEPIPHMALQRAGFTLTMIGKATDTDPAYVWERLTDDHVELYHIHRHDENKAPHRWSHRVDVWQYSDETGEWTRVAENVSLPDAIRRFGARPEGQQ